MSIYLYLHIKLLWTNNYILSHRILTDVKCGKKADATPLIFSKKNIIFRPLPVIQTLFVFNPNLFTSLQLKHKYCSRLLIIGKGADIALLTNSFGNNV